MKNMPHLDQHNLGDQDAEPDTELGDITKAQNLTCGDCGEKFNTINELILHDKDIHNPDVDPVEEDNFPWGPGFNQDSQNPGFGTQPIPESAWSGSGGM